MEMNSIRIHVNINAGGFVFSTTPSIREAIVKLFPYALPANTISVNYDYESGFEANYNSIRHFVYPALLGIRDENELKKIDEVVFVNLLTGKVLQRVIPGE